MKMERRTFWKPSKEQFRIYLAGLDYLELVEVADDIKRRLDYEADAIEQRRPDPEKISRLAGDFC